MFIEEGILKYRRKPIFVFVEKIMEYAYAD
jgi:hypothetical protein